MPERPTSSDHSPVAAVGCLAHSPQSSVPTAELSPGRAMSETIFFLLIISSFFLCRHLPRPVDVRRPLLRCPRIWHFAGLHPPSLPPPLCSHHNLPRSPPHTRTAPPPTGRGRNGKQLKKMRRTPAYAEKSFPSAEDASAAPLRSSLSPSISTTTSLGKICRDWLLVEKMIWGKAVADLGAAPACAFPCVGGGLQFCHVDEPEGEKGPVTPP